MAESFCPHVANPDFCRMVLWLLPLLSLVLGRVASTPDSMDGYAIPSSVNIGPLTTVFTPPSSCSSITLEYIGTSLIVAWRVMGALATPSATECYPSGYDIAYIGWTV